MRTGSKDANAGTAAVMAPSSDARSNFPPASRRLLRAPMSDPSNQGNWIE